MLTIISHRIAPLTLVLIVLLTSAPLAGAERYAVTRGVQFASPQRVALACDVYRPVGEGPFPGVLVIHGGAWSIGTRKQLFHVASHLARHGYVAVLVDYRLAPGYKFPAQLQDVRTGLDWMIEHAEQYAIDIRRLAAWGYSAGGHLAALLGAQDPRLQAVVAGGAPCDLGQLAGSGRKLAYFLGGSKDEVPGRYKAASPIHHVSPDDPPMFFYHGRLDLLVPLEQPRAMAAALKKAGGTAEVYVLPKVGHAGALIAPRAIVEGRKFLRDALKRGDPPSPRPPSRPSLGR